MRGERASEASDLRADNDANSVNAVLHKRLGSVVPSEVEDDSLSELTAPKRAGARVGDRALHHHHQQQVDHNTVAASSLGESNN